MARRTLDDILADEDPHGLLEIRDTGRGKLSSEAEKDRAVLEEASIFFAQQARKPDTNADDLQEAILARKLTRVREGAHVGLLSEHDKHGLLSVFQVPDPEPEPSWRDEVAEDIALSLDDILDNDDFGLDDEIIKPTNVTAAAERAEVEHVGQRVPCKDFELFAPLFEDIHAAITRGDRERLPFTKKGQTETLEGDFFIQKGLYAYVAEKSEATIKGGRRDHRLRVIYSNGTESDILMRSLEKALYADPTARRVEGRGFGPLDANWDADKANVTGYIYVARSKSTRHEIAQERAILHKIGVTSGDVRRRVADARNDATFLYAPVDIVTTYELHGIRRDKVEHILHTFFAGARAVISLTDPTGRAVRPKEWFRVTPELVSHAVKAIKDGTIAELQYDVEKQQISKRG
ncbi:MULTISPECIES: GIY-YIG nuclease family protein [unclassified Pseudovibrio]|uniref:GIY-YIG nuclease family protein n=1 Tax=unclassified Pseudovibrio TaxID=2627060 RepID=UPI0007AEC650|nr:MULTISPECIES: GIY-YIG nuclease family protein [unclassified Pseudovibrio]KZK95237.1 T5orf172 domain protein [Pseudovibrio sp. W74]KZL10437.1 T5orf172 domain protein [Pseudovibrio sp. Ad14]